MVERRTARNVVDLFFMEQYHACAEDLPENLHAGDLDPTFAGEEAPPDDISKVFNWTPEAALAERIPHLLGPEPDAPTRHLPPGKPVLLFWQMKAWWAAIQEITSKKSPHPVFRQMHVLPGLPFTVLGLRSGSTFSRLRQLRPLYIEMHSVLDRRLMQLVPAMCWHVVLKIPQEIAAQGV